MGVRDHVRWWGTVVRNSCFVLLRGLGVNAGAMTDEGSMTDEFWHLSFYNRMLFSILMSKNEG